MKEYKIMMTMQRHGSAARETNGRMPDTGKTVGLFTKKRLAVARMNLLRSQWEEFMYENPGIYDSCSGFRIVEREVSEWR